MNFDEVGLEQIKRSCEVSILLVVATDIELEVMRSGLKPFEEGEFVQKTYLSELTVYIGLYGEYCTALVKTNTMGATQRGASYDTTSAAIGEFMPKVVIMPGIAFGRDSQKQHIGDILVSKTLLPYESQRINHDGTKHYRGETPSANMTLYNRFTQNKTHRYQYENTLKEANIVGGGILTGEKLVDNIQYKNELIGEFPTAVGGEMEGLGVYAACDSKQIPWIVVKSICDWGDGSKLKIHQHRCCSAVKSFINASLKSKRLFESLGVQPFWDQVPDVPEIRIDAGDPPRDMWTRS